MAFQYHDLDDVTRKLMVEEIEWAIDNGQLYSSTRFTLKGSTLWPGLLLGAAREHDEHWLAYQLDDQELIAGWETARKPSGGYSIRHVPSSAAETQAEGQFNRYYMLALCRRATEAGIAKVVVYRAKQVASARSSSQQIIGQMRDPLALLAELRSRERSLKSDLTKPNSGLSIRLP